MHTGFGPLSIAIIAVGMPLAAVYGIQKAKLIDQGIYNSARTKRSVEWQRASGGAVEIPPPPVPSLTSNKGAM